MAVTPKKIIASQFLTTTATDVSYTTPNNVVTQIRKATFCNTSTTDARTVTIYLIDSGGSAGDSETNVKQKTLGPKETWSCHDVVGHYLGAGDKLQAIADAGSAVTIRVSALEIPV